MIKNTKKFRQFWPSKTVINLWNGNGGLGCARHSVSGVTCGFTFLSDDQLIKSILLAGNIAHLPPNRQLNPSPISPLPFPFPMYWEQCQAATLFEPQRNKMHMLQYTHGDEVVRLAYRENGQFQFKEIITISSG
jgi:hypothetical protein